MRTAALARSIIAWRLVVACLSRSADLSLNHSYTWVDRPPHSQPASQPAASQPPTLFYIMMIIALILLLLLYCTPSHAYILITEELAEVSTESKQFEAHADNAIQYICAFSETLDTQLPNLLKMFRLEFEMAKQRNTQERDKYCEAANSFEKHSEEHKKLNDILAAKSIENVMVTNDLNSEKAKLAETNDNLANVRRLLALKISEQSSLEKNKQKMLKMFESKEDELQSLVNAHENAIGIARSKRFGELCMYDSISFT